MSSLLVITNTPSTVGSLVLGLAFILIGGGYTYNFLKDKKTYLPIGSEFNWEDSPLAAWVWSITFGPLLFMGGIFFLGFFVFQMISY